MRATAALAELVESLNVAHERKLLPSLEALAGWRDLARQVQAEAVNEWQKESAFRLRTGASPKWCRNHFSSCQAQGLARRADGKREWHISARAPRKGTNALALEERIVSSFRRAS